jgi:hypothetical protein
MLQVLDTCHIVLQMANQRSPDKEVIGVYVTRTLATRIRRAAKNRGLTVTAFIEENLTHATKNTTLLPQDYIEIAEATQRAIDGTPAKRARRKDQKTS